MGSESLSQSNKLVQKHEIRWRETGSWFNTDDDLADRAFRAAVEFLTETGIYCTSTNRVIHFTEDEVLDAIREAPEQVHMGEGRDARVFKQQALEGRTALNFCPGHHAPFTEELAPLVVKNMAGMNAGQTPLEAEWMLEVADATQRAGHGGGRVAREWVTYREGQR